MRFLFLLMLLTLGLLVTSCFGGSDSDWDPNAMNDKLASLDLDQPEELYSEFFTDKWRVIEQSRVRDTLGLSNDVHLCKCLVQSLNNPNRQKVIYGDCNQLVSGHIVGNCLSQQTMSDLDRINITRDSVTRGNN